MANHCGDCGREAGFEFTFCPYCGASSKTADVSSAVSAPEPAHVAPPDLRRAVIAFDREGSFYTPIEAVIPAAAPTEAHRVAPWDADPPREACGTLRLTASGLEFTLEAGDSAVIDASGRRSEVVGSRHVGTGDTLLIGGARLRVVADDATTASS